LPLLVQLELESIYVNSNNFMVVHCLPCNYRIYIVFYCLHLHAAKSSGEINIYAYINPIVAVLLGALIFGAYNGDRNWRWNNYFGLYMVNHSIRKPDDWP
jgi:hypothetical protein